MKHFIILLTVALLTLTIMFALYRPDILEDIWLWLIGLIGPIVGVLRESVKGISKFLKSLQKTD